MAVRAENGEWKNDALTMFTKLYRALDPLFEETLKKDMTPEDFFYLVNDVSQKIILSYYSDKKYGFNDGGN